MQYDVTVAGVPHALPVIGSYVCVAVLLLMDTYLFFLLGATSVGMLVLRKVRIWVNTVSHAQRSYLQLGDLPVGSAPTETTVQLSTDGETYAFSIKDNLDACHGAVFSDQAGVIYVGAPLR